MSDTGTSTLAAALDALVGVARAAGLDEAAARAEGEAVAAQFWTVEDGTAYIHKLAHLESAKALSAGTTLSAALFEKHNLFANALYRRIAQLPERYATVAEDSSTNNLDGTYSIATDDSSLWWRLDEDTNATYRPSPEIAGRNAGRLPLAPACPDARLTRVVVPAERSRTIANACFSNGSQQVVIVASNQPFSRLWMVTATTCSL